MFLAAGRHIEVFRQKAEAAGKPLPITINMGLDPAIYIGACFEAPTTPFGYNELGVAGALRQRPVELVQGVSVPEKAIARAEIVIEGELLPGVRVREDQHTNSGHAMPEFPGYCGGANPSLPVIKVKAVTMRNNAILQTRWDRGRAYHPRRPANGSQYLECRRGRHSGLFTKCLRPHRGWR